MCVCVFFSGVQVEVEVHVGSAGQSGFQALCLELLGMMTGRSWVDYVLLSLSLSPLPQAL